MKNKTIEKKMNALVDLVNSITETMEKLDDLKIETFKERRYIETSDIRKVKIELEVFKENIIKNYISKKNEVKYSENVKRYVPTFKFYARGELLVNRNLRTIFDPFSPDYNDTTFQQKTSYLCEILNSNLPFEQVIIEYKAYYQDLQKPEVSACFENGLARIINRSPSRNNDFLNDNVD